MIGLVCVILSTGLCSVYAQTDCSNLPDGHYSIGCKVYDECKNHVLTSIECKQYFVYNNATKMCDHKTNVLPPCGLVRDCSSIPDGTYAETTLGCTSYYTCNYHIYYGHNFCTEGTVFENTLGTCVWPADAYPPCGNKV